MKPALRRIALLIVAALACTAHAQSINEDFKIIASDAAEDDQFGRSVAVSGTTAIVGAYGNDDAGSISGSAYVFDNITGQQLFKLTADDAAEGDGFGWSVAITGTTAIVGAPSNGPSGAAYLFDTTTGEQLLKLTDDGAPNGGFGKSVAIDGTTAIVGAHGPNEESPGAAYLFDITSGKQLFKLTASDAAEHEQFGVSVAISGTTAIVGKVSFANVLNEGAYVFDTTTGKQLFKLIPSDLESENYSRSVSISGSTAIVSSPFDRGGTGAAYLFDATTGQELFKFTANDVDGGDGFGSSVSISGNTAIISAIGDNHAADRSGAAYLFDTNTGEQLAKLTASDAAERDFFGIVAISGTAAIVGVNADDDAGESSGSAYLFDLRPPCNAADLARPNHTLDLADIVAFVTAYTTLDPTADLTGDGAFDLEDIDAFTTAFIAGCQ